MKKTVFYVSDRTGITAETIGHSLLTQFQDIGFNEITLPFIDTKEKAKEVVSMVNVFNDENDTRPILFCSIVNDTIRDIVLTCDALVIDHFNTFIDPLEKELGVKSSHSVGLAHSMGNIEEYQARIDAINFALNNDDGITTRHYKNADVILVGVSRCGKTPTCLYLALQFGIFAANYPLTEEDLQHRRLPRGIYEHKAKVFGLTIDPMRLCNVRKERRSKGRYASNEQCFWEVSEAEKIYKRESIPYLSTTNSSVEEIASKIMSQSKIKRRTY